MKKFILLSIITFFISSYSAGQTSDVKIHVKTFDDTDGTFIEKEDDGSGSVEYFNEFFDDLYFFVEVDPQFLGKYFKPDESPSVILKLTVTKGTSLVKEFKKTVRFSSNGFGLNKCFVFFQLNKFDAGSFKIKAELIKGSNIIYTAKKNVNIGFGE